MGFRRKKVNEETTTPKQSTSGNARGGSTSKSKSGGGGSSNFVRFGAILESKDGAVYVKMDGEDYAPEITVNGRKVTRILSNDPTEKFFRMAEAGKMSQEEAQEKADSVPEYVLSELTFVLE